MAVAESITAWFFGEDPTGNTLLVPYGTEASMVAMDRIHISPDGSGDCHDCAGAGGGDGYDSRSARCPFVLLPASGMGWDDAMLLGMTLYSSKQPCLNGSALSRHRDRPYGCRSPASPARSTMRSSGSANLTCISHTLSAAARDKAASTSLHLLTVLTRSSGARLVSLRNGVRTAT
jgi:hypothetical protein